MVLVAPHPLAVEGREAREMNPDVVSAIARLRTDNALSGRQAAFFNRVADAFGLQDPHYELMANPPVPNPTPWKEKRED